MTILEPKYTPNLQAFEFAATAHVSYVMDDFGNAVQVFITLRPMSWWYGKTITLD